MDFRVFESRATKFSRAGIELNGDNGSVLGEVIFENKFIDNWSLHLPALGSHRRVFDGKARTRPGIKDARIGINRYAC
jgi:hypothetical protein